MKSKFPKLSDEPRTKRGDLGEILEKYAGVFDHEGYKDEADALKQSRELRGWDEIDEEVFTKWAEENESG